MSKGLFLDRDGTLIVDRDYLADPAGVEVLAGVPEALRLAQAKGYQLFLFSNQSGVGRGFFPLEAVHRCNRRMEELIGLGSPLFAAECLATERPDEPAVYRKPSPRFIDETVARLGLDRAGCWMVGDKLSDAEAGAAAGIRAALVQTGRGGRPVPPMAGATFPEFPDLLALARSLP